MRGGRGLGVQRARLDLRRSTPTGRRWTGSTPGGTHAQHLADLDQVRVFDAVPARDVAPVLAVLQPDADHRVAGLDGVVARLPAFSAPGSGLAASASARARPGPSGARDRRPRPSDGLAVLDRRLVGEAQPASQHAASIDHAGPRPRQAGADLQGQRLKQRRILEGRSAPIHARRTRPSAGGRPPPAPGRARRRRASAPPVALRRPAGPARPAGISSPPAAAIRLS